MRPLDGITVLALEQAVAAPFATRQLADLGARVIKVERPIVGDFARSYDETVHGQSSHFVWLNRSKESLTLDLKHDEAKEILKRLIKTSDILIQNLAPGAVDRLGFPQEYLKKIKSDLIICNISGYGADGPYSLKKAYDLLIQCESGVMSLTGTDETPSKTGISIADIAAGMYSYSGILTALFQKERNGKGSTIDVSMLEALGEWMGFPSYFTHYGGSAPKRTGAAHATIYPYGPFVTGDSKTVFLGIQNEREWQTFCCDVLKNSRLALDARFASNSDRIKNQELLTKIILQVFSKVSSTEVILRLDQANIANARMNTISEFWDHPQLEARNRWRDLETPNGKVRSLIPPVSVENSEPRMDPIPSLGADTKKILVELGFSKGFINKLDKDGVI